MALAEFLDILEVEYRVGQDLAAQADIVDSLDILEVGYLGILDSQEYLVILVK